jgi:hypothetical protein
MLSEENDGTRRRSQTLDKTNSISKMSWPATSAAIVYAIIRDKTQNSRSIPTASAVTVEKIQVAADAPG